MENFSRNVAHLRKVKGNSNMIILTKHEYDEILNLISGLHSEIRDFKTLLQLRNMSIAKIKYMAKMIKREIPLKDLKDFKEV